MSHVASEHPGSTARINIRAHFSDGARLLSKRDHVRITPHVNAGRDGVASPVYLLPAQFKHDGGGKKEQARREPLHMLRLDVLFDAD